ncbi:S1 family peptidase [Litorimonas sp. WD9-15]|uniref:S1 family peptidase n=1 Tax=Litorimonas sp. WD9-15 TaxID=3418716 RepID=UPI003D070AA5
MAYRAKKKRRFPDWIVYGLALAIFIWTAYGVEEDVIIPEPPTSPELGPLLPSESPLDEIILVDAAPAQSGTGTAFAINEEGLWLTARHVVDSCETVGLRVGLGRFIPVEYQVIQNSDLAVLQSKWTRRALPADLDSARQIGEIGYFFGYPQGEPGEVVGSLIARNRMKVRGRYTNDEAILAWSELGRSRGLFGSLGGMSGAPVLDKDGEIIGVVSAEAPRRGRIYSVAPRYLRGIITEPGDGVEPLSLETYGQSADRLRRDRRVAKVICLVD